MIYYFEVVNEDCKISPELIDQGNEFVTWYRVIVYKCTVKQDNQNKAKQQYNNSTILTTIQQKEQELKKVRFNKVVLKKHTIKDCILQIIFCMNGLSASAWEVSLAHLYQMLSPLTWNKKLSGNLLTMIFTSFMNTLALVSNILSM